MEVIRNKSAVDELQLMTRADMLEMSKKTKRVPYPKRDIVKSQIAFGFHGKLEAVGKIFWLNLT